MVDRDCFAQFLISIDQGREFALGINHKRQVDLVLGGELLRKAAQVLRSDLELIAEDVVAKFVAQAF